MTELCLPEGSYRLVISDSGGDGFGTEEECTNKWVGEELCGYYVIVGEVLVGGTPLFFHEEEFNFRVPATEEDEYCDNDFVVAVFTDDFPEETSWVVKNDNGDVVLEGE